MNLLVVLVDVTVMFLVVRVVCHWRPIRLLAPVEAAGRPLTDAVARVVDRVRARCGVRRYLSDDEKILVALVVLLVLRVLACPV
jgi:hypothetical protein